MSFPTKRLKNQGFVISNIDMKLFGKTHFKLYYIKQFLKCHLFIISSWCGPSGFTKVPVCLWAIFSRATASLLTRKYESALWNFVNFDDAEILWIGQDFNYNNCKQSWLHEQSLGLKAYFCPKGGINRGFLLFLRWIPNIFHRMWGTYQ